MKIKLIVDASGRKCLELINSESYEDFERAAYYCARKYNAVFSRKIVGPDACVWPALIDGKEITVSWNDMTGTRIHFENAFEEKMVQMIMQDLTNEESSGPRLKNIILFIRFIIWRIF